MIRKFLVMILILIISSMINYVFIDLHMNIDHLINATKIVQKIIVKILFILHDINLCNCISKYLIVHGK